MDEVSAWPETKERMAKLKALLDKHPSKASVYQGPRHKGDLYAALREFNPHSAPSQPRHGTSSPSGIVGHGGK